MPFLLLFQEPPVDGDAKLRDLMIHDEKYVGYVERREFLF